jgi:hypothetical protein
VVKRIRSLGRLQPARLRGVVDQPFPERDPEDERGHPLYDEQEPPAARAEPFEQQVARHLEQAVADEQDARAEPVDGGGETEVAVHLQRGVAEVAPVEDRQYGQREGQDQDAPPDLGDDGVGHDVARLTAGGIGAHADPPSRGCSARGSP